MNKCHILQVVVCLAMVFVIPTLAHGVSECYQCVYVDGYDIDGFTSAYGIKSEKACKKGNKLDDFVINCSSEDSWAQMELSIQNISRSEGTPYTCGRLSMKGKIGGKKAEVVLRTCLRANIEEDFNKPCLATSVGKELGGESEFSGSELRYIKELVETFKVSEDTEIGLCGCTEEKCNSSGTISGVISFTLILALVTKIF